MWFPKWHEELGELSLERPKVWKLYTDGLVLSKACTVSVRKFQRNYVTWHWRVLQSLSKNWRVTWKMNLVNFHARSWKSEDLHFDLIHLSKAYKYLDEKVQKSYISWSHDTEEWRKVSRKTYSLVPKTTWGIWLVLMWAVASLEICTLMCYFCHSA